MAGTREGTPPPKPDLFNLTMHPSARGITPVAFGIFADENANIKQNHERFRGLHSPHIEASRRQILKTAEVALGRAPADKPTKALILGAGNCIDIPLVELAQRFDEVTLVDLDRGSVQAAARKLEPALQEKVKIVIADITGVVGGYTQSLRKAASSRTFGQFIREAYQDGEQLTAQDKNPDFGDDNTFVCSQLLMTQLRSLQFYLLQGTAKKKYSHHIPAEYARVSNSLQQEHVRYLARSVSQEGSVHLADTYRVTNHGVTSSMANSALISTIIGTHFNAIEPATHWTWENTPETTFFDVTAHSLQPIKRD